MSNATDTQLHARLLGGIPDEETDLLPSSLLAAAFFLIAAGNFWRFSKPVGLEGALSRPLVMLIAGIASIFTGLAFLIRAAYSNTAPSHQTNAGYIMIELSFIVGEIAYIDAAITLSRDLIIMTLSGNPHILFTLFARVVLIVALVLDIAAFAELPASPPFDDAQTGSAAHLRLASSMLILIIVAFNLLLIAGHGIFESPRGPSFAILVMLNLFVIPAALYVFVEVSVVDDSSPLVSNHNIFFYLAMGLFQALHALILVAVDVEKYFWAARRRYLMLSMGVP